jgi:uncharacterized membrane protein
VTLERLAVWAAGIACVAVAWVGTAAGVAVPADRPVVLWLAAVAALPLAVVALAWLSSLRKRQRGWT